MAKENQSIEMDLNACDCDDWKNFMPQIVSAQILAILAWPHSEKYTDSYKPFKFCPWCGQRLVKSQVA